MKKFVLFLLLAFGALTLNAQVRLSLKAGANYNLSEFNFSHGSGFSSVRNPAGFHAGLAMKVKIIPVLYLQVDGLYNYNTYKFAMHEQGVVKSRQHNIEVPVVVGAQIAFLRLYAGPRFSFDVGSRDVNTGPYLSIDRKNQFFGYQAGIGLNILRTITFDVTYNGYFTRAKQDMTVGGYTYTEKLNNRQIWFTLGFLFL